MTLQHSEKYNFLKYPCTVIENETIVSKLSFLVRDTQLILNIHKTNYSCISVTAPANPSPVS